ncbi:PAS domain S-box protein [Bacillus sp. FJAT-44742]|uniref:PAS domain S-box protein n=1 Tax=Bacillus sp. FJAT-44742 TaxID=2014005 RepID=UPI000C23D146|nr:PAS domain S-box protein [Bacillus sp. FJAT-44742]
MVCVKELYDKVSIPLFITTLEGAIKFVNEKGKNAFQTEDFGRNIFSYIPNKQVKRIKMFLDTLYKKESFGNQISLEVEALFADRSLNGEVSLLDSTHLLFQFPRFNDQVSSPQETYKAIIHMIAKNAPLSDIIASVRSSIESYIGLEGSSIYVIEHERRAPLSASNDIFPAIEQDHDVSGPDLKSSYVVPLHINGDLAGELICVLPSYISFSNDKKDFLTTCADLLSFALDKKSREKQVEARFLPEHAGDAGCVLDAKGTIQYATPSNTSILGYEVEEVEGTSTFDLLHPDDVSFAMQVFEEAVLTKKEQKVELRYRRKDNRYIDLALTIKSVVEDRNQVSRMVVTGRDITEKKQARRRLEEIEQRYKSLFEHSPYHVFSLDLKGRVVSMNTPSDTFLGYRKEELIGPYSPWIHPDYLAHTNKHFTLAANGTPQAYETVCLNTKGEEVYFKVTNIPVKVEERVVSVYGMLEDITEKKKAQKKIEDREEKLSSLLNAMPEFVLFKNKRDKLIEMNDSARVLFGMKREKESELVSRKPMYNLSLISSSKDEVAWKQKGILQYEQNVNHPNGEVRTFEIVKAPQFSNLGDRKYLVTIGRDITRRQEMEAELQETKEQLWALFTHSADAISILTLEGDLLKANPAFYSLYGFCDKDKINVFDDLAPGELYQETKQALQKVKNGEEVIDYQTLRRRKDGDVFDVSITFSPIQNKDGQVTGISAISRDIHERKKTEQLLRRSEKLSALGQLAAAVAHEVRNPITTVKGFTQLLQGKVEFEYTDLMLSELDRVEIIINEFLTLAKPQAVHFKEEDVADVIHNILALVKTQAAMHSIEIQTYFQPDVLPIFCDSNQIKQVFLNILKNAIEAMPNGGLLKIEAREFSSYVEIEIEDDGIGISPERMRKLGEPFYSNKEKGTGLGLMVCYKIIEEHHGEIYFASEEGKGTTVTIRLPREK